MFDFFTGAVPLDFLWFILKEFCPVSFYFLTLYICQANDYIYPLFSNKHEPFFLNMYMIIYPTKATTAYPANNTKNPHNPMTASASSIFPRFVRACCNSIAKTNPTITVNV